MSFTIFSGIPDHVVSVQVDQDGMFEVLGVGQARERTVNLGFAQVVVTGIPDDRQAQRVVGIANGSRFEVLWVNNRVLIQPRP